MIRIFFLSQSSPILELFPFDKITLKSYICTVVTVMAKQCWSQTVLESGSWGHSVLQTPALVIICPVKHIVGTHWKGLTEALLMSMHNKLFCGHVGTHLKRLAEALLMSTHTILFCKQIRKILPRYPSYLELCKQIMIMDSPSTFSYFDC